MDNLNNLLQNITHIRTSALNDWGSIHPLIVHFPIGLLLIVPLFIVLGLIFSKQARAFYLTSLILLWIGTIFLFLAVSSGKLAGERVQPNPAILETLETHEHFAEESRTLFCILAIVLTGYVSLCLPFPKLQAKWNAISLIGFLFVYTYALLILTAAAHHGGQLVHLHGITSKMYK
ncbi:MAG: hypothetical protein Q7S13_04470 [Candidatus Omnitrophota bacterium]|nr:hypothetical protein [Candidatus Omnitrophota bacterium]